MIKRLHLASGSSRRANLARDLRASFLLLTFDVSLNICCCSIVIYKTNESLRRRSGSEKGCSHSRNTFSGHVIIALPNIMLMPAIDVTTIPVNIVVFLFMLAFHFIEI